MANYPVHSAAGIAVWGVFAGYLIAVNALTLELAAVSFLVAFVGSLLADADTPKSRIGHWFEVVIGLGSFAFAFIHYSALTVQAVVNSLIVGAALFAAFLLLRPKHRGATHTIRASVVYGLLVFVWAFTSGKTPLLGVLALLSYASHLVLDSQLTW
ncbi:MAG: metal-dependent hydrolase [Candidatus Diapherotrites archaeon]|nr:metal-dependent hydrolase [Candidatus Diapherotrites archaeon]